MSISLFERAVATSEPVPNFLILMGTRSVALG